MRKKSYNIDIKRLKRSEWKKNMLKPFVCEYSLIPPHCLVWFWVRENVAWRENPTGSIERKARHQLYFCFFLISFFFSGIFFLRVLHSFLLSLLSLYFVIGLKWINNIFFYMYIKIIYSFILTINDSILSIILQIARSITFSFLHFWLVYSD